MWCLKGFKRPLWGFGVPKDALADSRVKTGMWASVEGTEEILKDAGDLASMMKEHKAGSQLGILETLASPLNP